ncbi:SpoIIE family protein phosphatase [Streptomyces sp. NPDC047434]|uniref:PP2C family protein-serine/threonine phosphatase n=1 Tax=Streptomyces sp. NPDC047434 TaxID=3155143 RepID=UPI0033D70AA6
MTDRQEPGEWGRGMDDDSPFASNQYVPGHPLRSGDAVSSPVVQEVLDGLPGSAIFLMPERGPDGAVVDFRITAASPDAVDIASRRGKELIGLSVLKTYPTVVGTDLWRGYLSTLESGVRFEGEPFEYQEVVAGLPRLSRFAVRAAGCQSGLIVSWVRLDSGEREQRRLAVMQRLGQMGWADWDLTQNVITWSDEVYRIFDRDPSLGPVTLEELPELVVGEDLPALGDTVQRLLGAGESIDHTFRITTPGGGIRHLRIVAEAETDVRGKPVEVHGFFQDRSAAKQAERQLLDQEEAALIQRSALTAERELAARLQHALLPLSHQSLHLADLTVDVAYQPSQEGLNVGGDWYSAIELPDRSVLLVVGDVAGHGLDAVATMAQLRFTAKGMAITEASLPTILQRLNTLLLHTSERSSSTATMIMARYDPATAEVTWVQAGHLPPLLLRGGEARYLPAPAGVLLGGVADPSYEATTLRLLPGDHLLLYTDGLIEQPSEPLDDGLARLADASRACGGRLDGILRSLVKPDVRRDDICVLHVSL